MNLPKKQIFILLGFIILLIAIPASLYLVRQQQILKSRADFTTIAEFVDSAGNVITTTDSTAVKLRIRREAVTVTPTPTPTPTPGVDADGDGFPSGTDCYDQNANAKPGQTQYFSQSRGDGSFDYDCDGAETKEFASVTTLPQTSGTIYSSGAGDWCFSSKPDGNQGPVSGDIPGCGQDMVIRACTKFSQAGCTGSSQGSDGPTCGTTVAGIGPAVSWAVVNGLNTKQTCR